MKRIGVVALAALFLLAWSAGDASAWRRHRRHYSSRVVFSFGYPAYYPYPYYPAYCCYEPVAVYPAPVYYPAGLNQSFGTFLGAVAGTVIGAQIGSGSGRAAAAAGGMILGSLIGNSVGRSLDVYDRQLLGRSTQMALETSRSGTGMEWRNPNTGVYGTVVPQPAFQNQLGQYCREYQQTVIVGGEQQQAYGTACRQDDGQWKIVQ